MNLMKDQPVLTVGVASGALAILLLALGSFLSPAEDSVRPPGGGSVPVTLFVEGELQPGMETYAKGDGAPGLIRVGRVVGDHGGPQATLTGSEKAAWQVVVAGEDQPDF